MSYTNNRKSNKKISIVLLFDKNNNLLLPSLDSIIELGNNNHCITIINDSGSDENVNYILKAIKSKKKCRIIVNTEKLDLQDCYNNAIAEHDKSNNDILIVKPGTIITPNSLEEMSKVLYASEKHGFVCPRSNNAIFGSIPQKDSNRKFTPEESYRCFKNIKKHLPRYSIIPLVEDCCVLIKRQVINNFGFFAEDDESLYDYFLRINRYGYSAVMANHAYVYHYAAHGFAAHKAQLAKKHPYIKDYMRYYFQKDINPLDHFADLLDNAAYKKKRLLFSLYNLPPEYNGTSEYGLSLLRNFHESFNDIYDIHILTNPAGDAFHGLSKKYRNVYYIDTIQGTFHLAFALFHVFDARHLAVINRVALRCTFSLLDIIFLRCQYIVNVNLVIKDLLEIMLLYADGIITISEFSKNDVLNYYNLDVFDKKLPEVKAIPLGIKQIEYDDKDIDLPFANYILVIGNDYYHKALRETYAVIKNCVSQKNFIFIGFEDKKSSNKNFVFYKSGFLDEAYIQALYKNCDALLFPSQYEGFGLPVLYALRYNKKVIVFNNELNNELMALNKQFRKNFIFYNEFRELGSIIENVDNYKITGKDLNNIQIRGWKEISMETGDFVKRLLRKNINPEKLQERWLYFNLVENYNNKELIFDTLQPIGLYVMLSRIVRMLKKIPLVTVVYRKMLKPLLMFFQKKKI